MRTTARTMAPAVYGRLGEYRRTYGALPASLVRDAARVLGVSERTVWRRVAAGEPAQPAARRFPVDAELGELLLGSGGNVAAVHRRLEEEGREVPSLRTMQRAVRRDVPPWERAYWRGGEPAMQQRQIHLRFELPERNALWQADHVEIPVEVLFPRRTRTAVKPWMTTFIDDHSRAVMGYAVSDRPDASIVVAAFAEAILPTATPAGPMGGVPAVVMWDQGLEFVSEHVSGFCAAVGVATKVPPGYMPWHKGKIERFFDTIEKGLFRGLPGYTAGPRRRNGTLSLVPGEGGRLVLEELLGRIDEFIERYNNTPRGDLEGMSPAQRWHASEGPVRWMEPEELRLATLAGEQRIVQRDGIHFRNAVYVAAELNDHVGHTEEIRYLPRDRTFVDVYCGGRLLCTAKPQEEIDPGDVEEIFARRREAETRVRRQAKKIREDSKVRYAAATSSDPSPAVVSAPAPAVLLTPPGYEPPAGLDARAARRAAARLLGQEDGE